MKVLFLSPDFLLPEDRGLRVRTMSQLRLVCSLPEVTEVTLLSLCSEEVSAERVQALEKVSPKLRVEKPVMQPVHMRRHPRSLPRLVRLRLLKGIPYLVAKCDTAPFRALLERCIARDKPDLVYLGYFAMAAYLPDVRRLLPKARVVLEQHNVEWEIFQRLAERDKGAMRLALQWEARATRKFEQRIMREVDDVISISESDARAFRSLAGIEATVIPPVVELGKRERTESTKEPHLAYIGLLAWQPNAHGLDWFCDKVWPLVRAKLPDVKLTIAGSGLRKENGKIVVPEQWQKPGITTVGFVDSLEDLYKDTLAMIAPVLGGSGVRMKLLETMKAGMPTVTTSDGAYGLGVEDGREVLIGDEPSRFADAIVRILSDAALRAHMREAGYTFLAENHSAARLRDRLRKSLEGAAGAAGKGSGANVTPPKEADASARTST